MSSTALQTVLNNINSSHGSIVPALEPLLSGELEWDDFVNGLPSPVVW